MNMKNHHLGFSKNLLVLALLAALSPAQAEEEEIAQLIKPESSISIGVGATSGDKEDKAFFGQYNGTRRDNYYGLLDIDAVQRDDATGTWTTLDGRNLGLDDRELHFSQERQGDWKYFVDYNQLVRYNLRTIDTGVQGAGTTAPVVTLLGAPRTGTDIDLKIKREGVGLGLEKWLTSSLQFEANIKNEDKSGARVFGKGFACSTTWVTDGVCGVSNQWAILMLPEPIDSTTRQFEAKLNFSGDKLMLSGGYYGSFYTNAYGALRPTVLGNLNNPLGAPWGGAGLDAGLRSVLNMPMALPPDNEAHQFYVDGNYAFTSTTRMTFKYAFTRATQNDNFAGSGLTDAPAGRGDLGGKLDTHLAQLGLTTRPTSKLSVNANLRYEDRNDKTPQALYSVEGTDQFANSKYSLKKLAGKLEGSYQLPDNYRATLGVDYEKYDRGDFSSPGCAALDPVTEECLGDSIAGLSGLRAETRETGYRAELRRAMSETLTGAISYLTSQRDGSTWLKPDSLPATGSTALSDSVIYSRTAIFPMIFMDRTRDKVKVSADWAATERLSLQFMAENAKDWYSAPTTKGLRDSGSHFFSVDAALALSDAWKLNGYWSRGDQELHVDHSSGYMMMIRNLTTTLGVGMTGKLSRKFEVGGNLAYLNDSTQYNQGLDVLASANNTAFYNSFPGLPEVTYSEFKLSLYGKYAVQKSADIRVDLVHQRAKLEEWTWGANDTYPFLYSDNTTITIKPEQRVTFIGARYIYKWL